MRLQRLEWQQVVAAAVLLLVLVLALWEVPHALRQANASYRSDARFRSYQDAEAFEQSEYGVDPSFVVWLDRHLPGADTFYVATGTSEATTAPQQWLQFELLPRIERYDSPCSAHWVVLYATTAPVHGVQLGPLQTYRPGYAIGRVRAPCTT